MHSTQKEKGRAQKDKLNVFSPLKTSNKPHKQYCQKGKKNIIGQKKNNANKIARAIAFLTQKDFREMCGDIFLWYIAVLYFLYYRSIHMLEILLYCSTSVP